MWIKIRNIIIQVILFIVSFIIVSIGVIWLLIKFNLIGGLQ